MMAFQSIIRRSFSTSTEFKKIGVIGLGLMGHGIAQVCASKGFDVVAVETSSESLNRGMGYISKSLQQVVARDVKKGVDKAAAEEKADATLKKISAVTDIGALNSCDLVIEAAPESLALKESLYKNLPSVMRNDAVIASNTSGLEIAELASFFGSRDRIIGLHYFNPVQMMALCEVIALPETPQNITDAAMRFVKAQGKTPVLVKDSPGFVVNRLLVPYMAQAIAMHDRQIASVQDIDVAMKLGCGHPMGPLQLADYVGLDTTLFILQNWCKKYPNEPSFFIPAGLQEKVAAGKLGRKTGEGFYKWDGNKIVE